MHQKLQEVVKDKPYNKKNKKKCLATEDVSYKMALTAWFLISILAVIIVST